jgi:mono/diheme cytochrome c family protein
MASEPGGFGWRALIGIAVVINLILTVFLLQQVREARTDVDGLAARLASKQDVAMLRPLRVQEILDKHCTRCHTERRFASLFDGRSDIGETVHRMQRHPGAAIPAEEVPRIEAALLVVRCAACHGDGTLSQVALMPPDERMRFLRTKVRMPGSGFRLDRVGELYAAFGVLAGDR